MRLNNLALQVTIYFATVYIHSHVSERETLVTESAKDITNGYTKRQHNFSHVWPALPYVESNFLVVIS